MLCRAQQDRAAATLCELRLSYLQSRYRTVSCSAELSKTGPPRLYVSYVYLIYNLAFTRYCHDQYCMVYGLLKGGREGVVYCAVAVQ